MLRALNRAKYSHSIGRTIFKLLRIIWLLTNAGEALVVPLNYSKEFPPLPSSVPAGRLQIQVSVMLVNILGINEVVGEFQFSCFFRIYWNDTRLPYWDMSKRTPTLSPNEQETIWRPDIVIQNVRTMERNGIIKPTIFNARNLSAPQNFFYSSYIAISIGCPFHYSAYPMDIQACTINIGTMGLTTAEVDLHWHYYNKYKMKRVQFLRFQDLFRAQVCENVHKNVRKSTFGEHPQKTLIIVLQRNYGSAILQVYLPSVVFVVIAWLSVLVPPTMLRTRLLLNSTNLLTIISMFLSISKTESSRVPKVSYVTALSMWMFVCVGFCFSSVLLVILDIRLVVILSMPGHRLQVLRNMFRFWDRRQPPEVVDDGDAPEDTPTSADDDDLQEEFHDASDIDESELRARVAEKRLEWLSKTAGFERIYLYLYPILFILFVIVYFLYYSWLRNRDLHRVIDRTGGPGALYPGCWCLPGDTHPKCMKAQDYSDI